MLYENASTFSLRRAQIAMSGSTSGSTYAPRMDGMRKA